MLKPWLRVTVVAVVAFATLPFSTAASGAPSGGDVDVSRLWGQDRYTTSLAVARQFVQESGGSIDAAVLVSGRSWHDAVIAAGLAGTLDAPVVLTQKNEVPAATAEFLAEAGVARVVVVGSASAVSDEVLTSFASLGNVERISGVDPSAASVAVAQRMGDLGVMPGHGPTLVVASAEVFADAMVAGGFSARGGHPVLLTPPDALDAGVASYVTDSGAQHVVVMGGSAAVSTKVQDDLAALGVAVTRLGGRTRLHTAQVVAHFLEGKYTDTAGEACFDRSTAGLATAWVPFDAFSAGPLLGELCAPLLLTDPERMDPDVAQWIKRGTSDLLVFGGKAAVSSHALADLNDEAALESIFDTAADERAKIVARLTGKINAGSYGVNQNNVLRGPAGFKIDLDDCPSDWSDTTGITDTEIRIGQTLPQSGNLAVYDNVRVGMGNYFDWVNENDPVAGRQLTLVTKDDFYVAALTIEHVDTLLASENVFSIQTLGSTGTLVNYLKINSECVPHPFVISGHPAFGDPVNFPWTTGMQLAFSTEALLWGNWIEKNLRDMLPVKVGAVAMNVSFGRSYENAFRSWAEEHPEVVSEFVSVWHDPVAPTLRPHMDSLASLEPDVYISMTSGVQCLRAIHAAAESGLTAEVKAKGGALFAPSVCNRAERHFTPAGVNADGWMVAAGGEKDSTDPALGSDPYIKFVNQNLTDAGVEASSWLYGTGHTFGYAYVEALRVAAELPGGLTRSNFILAVRSLDITHPMYLDGVRFRLNGNADAYFVEASEFRQYDDDAKVLRPVASVLDVDGKTPNCAYDINADLCG